MKLIQDAIRLPLAWPDVAVIMGLWPLGETFQQGCRTTNSEHGFQVFIFYSYIISGVGGRGGSKNNQEIKRGGGGLN